MEASIVSAALLVVIFLLSVVVYDTNTTLQEFVRRLGNIVARRGKNPEEGVEEATMVTNDVMQNDQRDEEKPRGIVRRLRGVLRRGGNPEGNQEETAMASPSTLSSTVDELEGHLAQEGDQGETITPLDNVREVLEEQPRGIVGWLRGMMRRGGKPAVEQEDPVMALINTVQNAVDDLKSRLAPIEAALDKTGQLEGELTKVSEATQMLSENMQEVIGALRASIDGLESRLDQINPDRMGETEDEETKNKVKQLEEAVEDINNTVRSLPQDIQNNVNSIREVNNRLEVISADLRRTLGYGIQKTFKCGSCGSEGLVASQVICSKCGKESWWGWWPKNEELAEHEGEATEMEAESAESLAKSKMQ